jgi:quercetin dioxygenase-like cupin family protein
MDVLFPDGVEAMTVRLDLPPGDPGSPPHRRSRPVFGYMLEGEMIFELEGEPVYVDDEELEQRRDRRAPRPAIGS